MYNFHIGQLVQGVYYVFTIVGIDENGDESEAQNITVAYSDGKIKRTNADGSIVRLISSFEFITHYIINTFTIYEG